MKTLEKAPNLTQFIQLKPNEYQVREDITVFISQRSYSSKDGKLTCEAQAVFNRKSNPEVEDPFREHEVVLNLPELQQIAGICGYPQRNLVEWSTSFDETLSVKEGDVWVEKPRYAPDATWKEFKIRDCGMKMNLTVIDNAKLDLEYKFYKKDKYSRISLVIGDILSALALINLGRAIETKTFEVEGYQVKVVKQDVLDTLNLHQLVISTEIEGIERTQSNEYPAALIHNRDSDYIDFDEEKAKKLIAGFAKFLKTGTGKALTQEGTGVKTQLIADILGGNTGKMFSDFTSPSEIKNFLEQQNEDLLRGIATRCGSLSFVLPGWQYGGRFYAKDCPTCGGSGDNATGGTCDECNGSGEMPADDCPTDVVAMIVASNQQRGHDDDDNDDDGHLGEDCPVCGYPLSRSGECSGNGCGSDLGS